MGKGGARQQPVKGSKRKRYSSPPPVNKSSKPCSSSDSESAKMGGAAPATVKIKRRTSSDSDSDTSVSVEMKGRTSSSDCYTDVSTDVFPWSCRVRMASRKWSTNDGQQSGGVTEDLAKVQYIETTASGGDEQALERTKNLSHSAFPDINQSGFKGFHVKKLAEIFELRGKEAMQSKLYPAAIEYYNVAIAFGGDNAIYYCDRAAAYIQTCQYAEATLDCQKSIAIDPNYIKAYTRLGYLYFVQGMGTLEKGYRIATLLHPSVIENVRAAEHKLWQQREENGQTSSWSYSNAVMSVRDQVPSPLSSAMDPSDTNPGELYAAIRADISVLAELRLKDKLNA